MVNTIKSLINGEWKILILLYINIEFPNLLLNKQTPRHLLEFLGYPAVLITTGAWRTVF